MNKKRDTILIQFSDYTPAGLQELLDEHGYEAHTVSSLDSARIVLEIVEDPILVAHCGHSESRTIQSVQSLIRRDELHNSPIVLIGKDAETLEVPLAQKFGNHTALGTPCSIREILNCILWLEKNTKSAPRLTPLTTPEVKRTPEAQTLESDTSEDGHLPRYRQLAKVLFEQSRKLKIGDNTLGGKQLMQYSHFSQLQNEGYLPQSERMTAQIEKVLTSVKPVTARRLCRTTYMSTQVASALNLPEDSIDQAKAAAFLYAISFAGSGEGMLSLNYLSANDQNRHTISTRMFRSADSVRTSLGEPVVADLIVAMGKIIARDADALDEDLFMTASVLVAADLVDRVCFEQGLWNTRGANYLMRKARSGALAEIHPEVLACTIKFVTEAVSSLPKVYILNREKWLNSNLQEIANEEKAYKASGEERSITITSLEPGMRLARPIYSYDGELVIEAGIILDEDLIWRIWQLSAIRLLNTPITVKKGEALAS